MIDMYVRLVRESEAWDLKRVPEKYRSQVENELKKLEPTQK